VTGANLTVRAADDCEIGVRRFTSAGGEPVF
jgi:hypothetical protein